ncbi:MAG: sodium-dependent bicarbonate transport family permease, partial [Balneolales bacterium]|nr:sodium-dependent bicarbonate transport family permease [Balneolales bacterium]
MDFLADFLVKFISQFQSPTLGFLFGGMLIAALGSRLKIPSAIYQFIVFMLLMKIGLNGGIEIREANLAAMAMPAFFSMLIGVIIVILGVNLFRILPGVNKLDGIATAGLFGAVSASTLAVAIVMLEEEGMFFEAWAPALYPFMDIPALILAIVLANIHLKKEKEGKHTNVEVWKIVKDSLRGSALSALLLGLALGLFTKPDPILDSFYEPLFRGFLSILMLIMGMEAYDRIKEL